MIPLSHQQGREKSRRTKVQQEGRGLESQATIYQISTHSTVRTPVGNVSILTQIDKIDNEPYITTT